MKNEERIVELAEMLHKFDDLNETVKIMSSRLDKVDAGIGKLNEEVVKPNLISGQNARSIMKLAENDDRISRLEAEVFKK